MYHRIVLSTMGLASVAALLVSAARPNPAMSAKATTITDVRAKIAGRAGKSAGRDGDGTLQQGACGCAASNHRVACLPDGEIERLIARFALEPMSEESIALETLLFHAPRARGVVERRGAALLDKERLDFLRKELSRTHARLSGRIVDEHGVVRARFGPVDVPLGEKRHTRGTDTMTLGSMEMNGTVRRVGLHHLWTRQ